MQQVAQSEQGNPFAVIESDPGVFTSLTRRLGIIGVEVVELYDIAPWAVDHLNPYGLIFCFLWKKDLQRPADFEDPGAEQVWFANQLSDDACATHAILNVVLNCPEIDIGAHLNEFKSFTETMSPVMRGLAVTNSPVIRPAHNYFARPADIRASLNNLTIATFDAEKLKEEQQKATAAASKDTSPPAKRQKLLKVPNQPNGSVKRRGRPRKQKTTPDSGIEDETSGDEDQETYHFIGYVPAHGKVWELDGLKSGPLEVGELPAQDTSVPALKLSKSWMDIVRPALRMKMEKYGGSGMDDSNIRFSLLAIVDDSYLKAHDDFELLRRERQSLENQMNQESPHWQQNVESSLLGIADQLFSRGNHPAFKSSHPGASLTGNDGRLPGFSKSFGSKWMNRQIELMELPSSSRPLRWATCVQNAMRIRTVLEDEINKAAKSNTDHVKRTHDYEPFIQAYIERLHDEGMLNALLDRDNDGRKKRGPKKKVQKLD
ncbi:hypothetical protein CPB83DRAFT_789076 [Crepidotus variabilis]|uniref:ubiquitinyl hydrolase 1 n=1 Tax=Crepidotus variabilis TaxID=179855 RepID=A0A9P6EJ59_9AGAR|nr:hypothetical protein CPB83DRAFT_789076 [Crepidotus variabilis]